VAAPALLVHGEEDRLVPAAFSVAIGQQFGWPVEVLPDAGHVPMMEAPADFLRVTLRWLESNEPAAA
jgi:pimeloyl-ACP methyl ester carboxylesterase